MTLSNPATGTNSVNLSKYKNESLSYSSTTTILELRSSDSSVISTTIPNMYNQSFSLSSTTNLLTLTDGLSTKLVDLSAYVNPDSQSLSSVLSIGNDANGSRIINAGTPSDTNDLTTKAYVDNNDDINDADADPNNEIQDLQLSTNSLSITGSSSPSIDLSPYLNQSLTVSQSVLNLTDGNSNSNTVSISLSSINSYRNPITNNSASITIGLSATSSQYYNINDVDVLIFTINSTTSSLTLEDLTSEYNGKRITIVEGDNQNPLISTNTTDYFNLSLVSDKRNFLFFQRDLYETAGGDSYRDVKYESVSFIWVWSGSSGQWYPMR